MSKLQGKESTVRRSARLDKSRGKVIVYDLPGGNLRSRIHFSSGSEEEGAETVLEGVATAAPSTPTEERRSLQSEDEFLSHSSDNLPTRLKYNRFRGDGSQDVDD